MTQLSNKAEETPGLRKGTVSMPVCCLTIRGVGEGIVNDCV